jgi:uncharacterized protein YjbI with pentapeptide repeats
MAQYDALAAIRKGPATWNEWRLRTAASELADLSSADLSAMDLSSADFSGLDLRWTGLRETNCESCNFRKADLMGANLRHARLVKADLREADLRWAHFIETDMRGADLRGALLQGSIMLKTDLRGADLSGARIFGASVWGVVLDAETRQSDLIITSLAEPTITADSIEVAQFLYLLLNNQKIRDVIDTLTTKAVLILGRFTPERKPLLDALRDSLRTRNYLPVLFDFDKPRSQTTMETISTLAHMVRFVVADLTDAKSVLQELRGIVPSRPFLPIQPIQLASQHEPGMFDFFTMYPWVLPTASYESPDDLLASVYERVIAPAEAKALELRSRKR